MASSSPAGPTSSPASPSPASTKPVDPPISLENDPERTGFDPQTAWWVNYFKILTGKVTPEGVFHYREQRYRTHEARDCATCERHRDWLFAHSPVVRFLREKVADLNGTLDETNVVCRRCPARLDADGRTVHRQAGGFSPAHGILICANEVRNRGHLEDTLAHEMVHAWDHLRWKDVDWVGERDLKQAACAEVSPPSPPFYSQFTN